jgi:antitoxin component of MazEF toxin-antitoxin module
VIHRHGQATRLRLRSSRHSRAAAPSISDELAISMKRSTASRRLAEAYSQVTIPRAFADQLHLRPGDEIEWRMAGEELRISSSKAGSRLSLERRLDLFDAATRRESARNRKAGLQGDSAGRSWKR